MDTNILDNIQIDPSEKRSIAYAKARSAIELVAKNRREKRFAKQAVIEFLKGEVEYGRNLKNGEHLHNVVKFPDGSNARY